MKNRQELLIRKKELIQKTSLKSLNKPSPTNNFLASGVFSSNLFGFLAPIFFGYFKKKLPIKNYFLKSIVTSLISLILPIVIKRYFKK